MTKSDISVSDVVPLKVIIMAMNHTSPPFFNPILPASRTVSTLIVMDARHQAVPTYFFPRPKPPQESNPLILDSVSGTCSQRVSGGGGDHVPFLPSHPRLPPGLLRAIVPNWWPLRPVGEEGSLGWAGQLELCSGHPLPVSVSREQPECLARLGFLHIFPLCQTEEEGSGEGESSGKLPRGEGGQQRKQEKYIFLSLLSPSKALYSSSFWFSPPSIPPASHFVPLSHPNP